MDPSVSQKDEIWFLRVCHHISNAVYQMLNRVVEGQISSDAQFEERCLREWTVTHTVFWKHVTTCTVRVLCTALEVSSVTELKAYQCKSRLFSR